MKLVLLGIQGSGKSTQGNLLQKKLGLPYLSTGHIFRKLAQEHTPLGRHIKETMNSGYLIPDSKTLEIVSEYLKRPEYQAGYILDGFPRTVAQAEAFENGIDKVISLQVTDREALWRLAYRGNDDNREDENLAAIKKRIELYHQFTDPVLEYYEKKGLLIEINGKQSIEKIHNEIFENLQPLLSTTYMPLPSPAIGKSIVAIVGMPGAGKSEAAHFFAEKGMSVLRFGAVVIEGLLEEGLERNAENEAYYRAKIREEHGMAGVAKVMLPKIKQAIKEGKSVVLDGLYSWEEYIFLHKEFPELSILCIYARPVIRYRRLSIRQERPFTPKEARLRDINEIEKANKGGPIALADYLIRNESTKHVLQSKLEKFLTMLD